MQSISSINRYRRSFSPRLPSFLLRRATADAARQSLLAAHRLDFNNRVNVFRAALIYTQTGIILDVFQ